MFNRLSGLVNSAVEVLAPQILRRDEAFRGHWAHITAYYERHFGAVTPTAAAAASKEGAKIPVSSNISYHLDHLVKYVKEEECEFGEETGPCLEYLLERRILDTLVEYATLDAPAGMRNQVLRSFSLLIANVRARLFPEAGVRVPLQKLIEVCHRSMAAESDGANLEMTEELVKLVHTVFRNLRDHPELTVLFFDRSMEFPDDGGQAHARFYIFSILLDFITSTGRVSRIAREALMLAVQIAAHPCTHPTVSEYLANDSHLCETMTEQLGIFYAMLPTRPATFPPETPEESPPVSPSPRKARAGSLSAVSVGSDESSFFPRTAPARLTPRQMALFQFLSFFQFVNDVSISGDEQMTRHLCGCFRTNFSDPICARIRASCQDEQGEQFTIYMTDIIKLCSSPALLQTLLSSLLCFNEGPTREPTHGASELRRTFILNMASSRESLSLATLRLFDAIITSCDQRAIEQLVLSPLRGQGPRSPLSEDEVRYIMEMILLLLPAGDDLALAFLDASDGSIVKAGGFDDYLIDAQERHVHTLAVSATSSTTALRIGGEQEAGEPCSSEVLQPGVCPVDDADAGLFLDVVLGELESVANTSSVERCLLITALLARVAALPDPAVIDFVYSEESGSRTIFCILKRVAQKLMERSRGVPDFLQKVRRIKETGLPETSGGVGDLQRTDSSQGIKSPGVSSPTTFRPSSTSSIPAGSPHEQQPMLQLESLASLYVILQEFCKELAATLFVKGAQANRFLGVDESRKANEFEEEEEEEEETAGQVHQGPTAIDFDSPLAPSSPSSGFSRRFLRRLTSSSLGLSSPGLAPSSEQLL